MQIGIYGRISTADKNQDVNLQLVPLREYCQKQGWNFTEYVDEGYSGSTTKRPALQRMLADCRRRRIDGVVIWKLDRLFRSLEHFVSLAAEFHGLNVRLISITETFDLGSPQGRLFANMLAIFAEFEKDLLKERIQEGLINAVRKGKRLGRKPVQVDVETLQKLRGAGLGIKKIARKMGLSIGLVHKWCQKLALQNPIKSGIGENAIYGSETR